MPLSESSLPIDVISTTGKPSMHEYWSLVRNSTVYQSAQIRCHRIYDVKWAKEKKTSRKYYCYIQTRAKYSQPSHPVRKEGVLQSCSGDSRWQVKRAPWLTQNVRSIIILCA